MSGLRAARSFAALLVVVRLVDEAAGYLPTANVEAFHRELGLSYGAIALATAAIGPGALVGQLPVLWSDGRCRKPVVVGGALVLASSLAVMAATTGMAGLVIGHLLFGAGSTALVEAGEISLAAHDDGPLERTIARISLGAVVGDLIGPVVLAAGRLAGLGWRGIFVVAAAAIAAYGVALALAPFPSPRAVADFEADAAVDFRLGGALAFGVLALVLAPLDESLLSLVLAFAERQRGASGVTSALIGVGFVVGGIASFTVLPRFVEGRAVHRVVGWAGLVMALATLAVTVVPVAAIVLVGVVYSAVMDLAWLSMQASELRLNPGREGLTGAIAEPFQLVGLFVPVLFAGIADRHGLRVGLAAYAVVPLAFAAAAVALRRRLTR